MTRAARVALTVLLVLTVASPRVARSDERVAITATDGVQLVGHLAGDQGPGVVLVHGYAYDQRSWTRFASEMAQAGVRTLTFDCRGYGESGGEKDVTAVDRDVEGAYRFLIGRKIRPVYLVGASMGGAAVLLVAARVPVAGVATLSAPVTFRTLDTVPALPGITARKLFVAAEGDAAAADAAKLFAAKAADPKTVVVVPGTDHGTALLAGAQKESVTKALRNFLTTPAPP